MIGVNGLGLVSAAAVCFCLAISTQASAHHEDFSRETCYEAPEIGACRAYMPRWFYNDTTGACEEFIWGGCPGSMNRFPNRPSCMRHCQPEVCELQPEVGPCRANIRAFYYDSKDRKCKVFSYGGCEGNENRFHDSSECETACAGTNLPCEFGSQFEKVGSKAVHANYRQTEWFIRGCDNRCEDLCLENHPWGKCLAYSVRKRWWKGCNCYLYDRAVSSHEFDPDTKGVTANRACVEGTKTGKKQKSKKKGRGKGKNKTARGSETMDEIDLAGLAY